MALAADSFQPSKHLTARDFVLEGIRDAMLNRQLVAGQELDDQALAETFGVSRTPVREALKVLEVQGFVTHRPFSKPVVAPLSADRIEEVFLMRLALEGTAVARSAVNLDEAGLDYLQMCLDKGLEAIERQDAPEWRHCNREFHTRLSAASGMPLLSREIDSLIHLSSFFSIMSWNEIPQSFGHADQEHRAILQACRDRNPKRARHLIEDHIARTLNVQVKAAHEREARQNADNASASAAARSSKLAKNKPGTRRRVSRA
jgi:DNA-binding GntR family transcriptional regulator